MLHERSEETHARLLEAAVACFSEQGFDGASVADICGRAQVSKGAFYHHFESKQALFLELLQTWLTTIDGRLADAQQQGGSAVDKLVTMVAALKEVLASAQGRLPLFLNFMLIAQRDQAVWAVTAEAFRHYHELVTNLLRQGVAEGSLRTVDADALAHSLVSVGLGFVVQSQLNAAPVDWAQTARSGLGILLRGLQAQPSITVSDMEVSACKSS